MKPTRQQILNDGFVNSQYTDINGLPAQAVIMWDDNYYYLAVEMTIDADDIGHQLGSEPSAEMLDVLRDSENMCAMFGIKICSDLDMVNARLKSISGDREDPEFYFDDFDDICGA